VLHYAAKYYHLDLCKILVDEYEIGINILTWQSICQTTLIMFLKGSIFVFFRFRTSICVLNEKNTNRRTKTKKMKKDEKRRF
jgi:hypothetical protein